MDENSLLIVGANGQLGTALRTRYPDARALESNELDITDAAALAEFDWSHIRVIINAAAYTNVDGAESPEGRIATWKVNACGAANLSRTASERNLTLVHISTDYVFDGSQSLHREDEPFSPLGVYAQSKAAGDIAVSLTPKHYILRASWVIGDGKNFVRTMIGLGGKGINPTVVADQIGRLTFTSELVRAIDHLHDHRAGFGTYNVSNEGEATSWATITRGIFRIAGFDLTVTDTTTAEYFAGKEGIAARPLQSTLDLTKIKSTGFESREWKDDLSNYIAKELNQ